MRLRSALCTVLTAVGVLAGSAAHATDCPLLTDPQGDGMHKVTGLRSPMLDLLSGDLASGPSTVVVVLRVANLNVQTDPLRYLDPAWYFSFEIEGSPYVARLAYSGLTGAWRSTFLGQAGPVAAQWVVTGDTITWTAPRSGFPELAEPGNATFQRFVSQSYLAGGNADVMLGWETTYVDRRPGCVPAG